MKIKILICYLLIGLLILSSNIIIYQNNKINQLKNNIELNKQRLGYYPSALDDSGKLILYLEGDK